jgi:PAS domain S-box-containing protein
MGYRDVQPTGIERYFDEDEIIVSKTDSKGIITYVNDVFIRVAGYKESDLIGSPHSMIRHPDMPRAIFKLLWDTVQKREELFAYVFNMTASGDHYWVLAHVTPTFGPSGEVLGYHSNRRVPSRTAVAQMKPLYERLLAEEKKHQGKLDGLAASTRLLGEILRDVGMPYDEWVWSIENMAGAAC